jgi:hypothetical protein
MSPASAFSIEDQFVDAVKGVFGTEPVWSTGPLILPRRAVQEMSKQRNLSILPT